MPYPRDNKDNQIPTLCPAPPPPSGFTLIGALPARQVKQTRHWHDLHSRHTCTCVTPPHSWGLVTYDVTDLERFPISPEVMLFFLSLVRILTFLALKFWFRASENVKWKSRNVVEFVSLTGWWAVTINESLPFGISLPLPAIIEIPLPALSSPVSRTPPAPCSPGLPPPCPPPLQI